MWRSLSKFVELAQQVSWAKTCRHVKRVNLEVVVSCGKPYKLWTQAEIRYLKELKRCWKQTLLVYVYSEWLFGRSLNMNTINLVILMLALLVPYISACKLLGILYFCVYMHAWYVECVFRTHLLSGVLISCTSGYLGGSNKDRVRLEDVKAITLTQVS